MLKHVTILSTDGITIYHKSFQASDIDDVLFSALSGAIIAFSKELGDELQSIIMKKQMIFFKSVINNNIVIFSFDTDGPLNQQQIEFKLNIAVKLESIEKISNFGVSNEVNIKLSEDMMKLFDINEDIRNRMMHEEKNGMNYELHIEELTGDAFLDALSKLDSI